MNSIEIRSPPFVTAGTERVSEPYFVTPLSITFPYPFQCSSRCGSG